ncbi:MAG: diadenylate cyclase CdaA [Alicyclobacillaceae bacterium]|uniref:diadenylate cyclase CdaA n=1 Tax=Alicyclobacillus sp. SP_1 TaxID=2942475 RepID=UPI0021576888|nr:diadenylate cyclase CdaA [Alicyclobacillus sp. SP_1]MCY0887390.1 diadenylate cyclase CdaA [Alicyclobacillaceae bacterium]MCY0895931.1 diadenylate cyclase CdaA [Alicyclobacillaceae bacterium]
MSAWLQILRNFNVLNILDILIVAFVLYRVLLIVRGTRAVQLLKGVIVILIATALSSALHLQALNWLLNKIITVGFFAIPVVFQPELRRALDQLGRGGFFSFSEHQTTEGVAKTIDEIVFAAVQLAKTRTGALIVVERKTGLSEYVETGTALGARVSSALLLNLFVPNTPLHDGAVMVRGDEILAAGCFLPLTENRELDKQLGTRHRAALGVSEQSDAVSIVVSEETGGISVGVDGSLVRFLSENSLRQLLKDLLVTKSARNIPFFRKRVAR